MRPNEGQTVSTLIFNLCWTTNHPSQHNFKGLDYMSWLLCDVIWTLALATSRELHEAAQFSSLENNFVHLGNQDQLIFKLKTQIIRAEGNDILKVSNHWQSQCHNSDKVDSLSFGSEFVSQVLALRKMGYRTYIDSFRRVLYASTR